MPLRDHLNRTTMNPKLYGNGLGELYYPVQCKFLAQVVTKHFLMLGCWSMLRLGGKRLLENSNPTLKPCYCIKDIRSVVWDCYLWEQSVDVEFRMTSNHKGKPEKADDSLLNQLLTICSLLKIFVGRTCVVHEEVNGCTPVKYCWRFAKIMGEIRSVFWGPIVSGAKYTVTLIIPTVNNHKDIIWHLL